MGLYLGRLEYVWLLFGIGLISYISATSTLAPAIAAADAAGKSDAQPQPPRPDQPQVVGFRTATSPADRINLRDELRRKYPYVSLQPRLAKLKRPAVTNRAEVDLTAYIEQGRSDYQPFAASSGYRAHALEMLHSEQVEDFINTPGLGRGRNFSGPEHLLALPAESHYWTEQVVSTPRMGDGQSPSWSPSHGDLLETLATHQGLFAAIPAFGHWVDREHVAGFRPHAFLTRPQLVLSRRVNRKPVAPAWKITRLQLVSLLMQDEAAVYVSKWAPQMSDLAEYSASRVANLSGFRKQDTPPMRMSPTLPRMSQLTEHPITRELDEFERTSLAKLEAGENVVYRATINQIEMLGAIRAVNQCLACHAVERGALLGAFSYSLFRDPPADVPEKSTISAR